MSEPLEEKRPVLTHCAICGRPLSDALSVDLGIGPVCREESGYEDVDESLRAKANELIVIAAQAAARRDTGQIREVATELRGLGLEQLADALIARFVRWSGAGAAPMPEMVHGDDYEPEDEGEGVSSSPAPTPPAARPRFLESDLSSDQLQVYETVNEWVRSGRGLTEHAAGRQLLTFGGFAGTGKTTVLSVLAQAMGVSVTFTAFTGRAVSVLSRKMREAGVTARCMTLHSLLYHPVERSDGSVEFVVKTEEEFEEESPGLIVIDEASMVPREMFELLQRFGHRILAVGDHGQLPPIGGAFSLMQNPTLRLEKIHRQAEGNAIIRLSASIRETGRFDRKFADNKNVFAFDRSALDGVVAKLYAPTMSEADLTDRAMLCYMNKTRQDLNDKARRARRGWQAVPLDPQDGEQVVCLKNTDVEGERDERNARSRGPRIFNGQRGFFGSPKLDGNNYIRATLRGEEFPGGAVPVRANRVQFGCPKKFDYFTDVLDASGGKWLPRSWGEVGQLFDFGYALTVHKFQGSQARDVLVVYERPSQADNEHMRRWLYTAATRASERLAVIL